MQRADADPNLHIYHYAPYEPTAMKRLMGMHGTREHEVDVLLRGERFVDLYAVVRQGVRIGSESYSLKKVEKLYMQRPEGEVMDAGGSIVAYEEWLESRDQAKLDEIRGVQRRRLPLHAAPARLARGRDAPRRRTRSARSRGRSPAAARRPKSSPHGRRSSKRWLTHDLPDDPEHRTTEQQACWLLAQLLHWHRREEKPEWWAYYHRVEYESDDDFTDDRECIGGLEFVGEVGTEQKSTMFRYEFEPQDHKFSIGSEPFDPATERARRPARSCGSTTPAASSTSSAAPSSPRATTRAR